MRILKREWALALAVCPVLAHAQISTDGSVGARVSLTGPNFAIPALLGARMGANLFHSFSTFGVGNGQSATFFGPQGIDNVIARITGGSPSAIDGLVRVSIPQANLYLVNPAGIVFGAGASLDVPGAFHASTAHALHFADGTTVAMGSASPVTLTAASPAAFGFDSPGAAISLSGAQLSVREGRRIGLVAGDVSIDAAAGGRVSSLTAPSGAIAIVATRGAGTVAIEGDLLSPSGFASMGALGISGNSALLANEGPARNGAGTIRLRGGDVTLDHARLESRTRFAAGRGIDIAATGRLAIDATNVISWTTGAGNAGPLRLAGRDIDISGGSLVDTSCDFGCTVGRGGSLDIVATGDVTIRGTDPLHATFVVSNSFGGGPTGPIGITAGGTLAMSGAAFIQGIGEAGGDGSSITLRTGAIDLSGGAQIDASTRGTGRGGDIVVENAGRIRVSGLRPDPEVSNGVLPSGFFSNTEGSGHAGTIVISTATLEVLDRAQVSSSARRGSTGAGGRIQVRATDLVRIAGRDETDDHVSAIVANTFSTGEAGEIDLSADRLEIVDGGRLQTQSEGAGRASAIRVRVRELLLAGQGQISSDARSGGDGGVIDVDVAQSLTIEGANSGIFAKTYGPARGGAIRVSAGDLSIDGGGIFAGSDGTGAGGNVDIAAARTVAIANAGSIAANARSTGFAGNVSVSAGRSLTLGTGSGITTEARLADGGDISVNVGERAVLDGGRIATAVGSGQGAGGNITLAVPTLVLRGATVSANAFGGPGGNIRIGTETLFRSANSAVTASSTLGIDGTITFDSPALDPTGELLVPGAVFLDAGAVLAGRCGARLAGRASSLVVVPPPSGFYYPDEPRPLLDGIAASYFASQAPAAAACAPARAGS